jgi:hypothetical protein
MFERKSLKLKAEAKIQNKKLAQESLDANKHVQ